MTHHAQQEQARSRMTVGDPAGQRRDDSNPTAADEPPTLDQATACHQRGVAANSAGHPQLAAEHFRAGLALLGPAPTTARAAAQAARLLLSLAHAEAEQGRVEHGLALLDQAEPLAASQDRGLLLSQRALLHWRAGRYQVALPLFDEAVTLLASHPDPIALVKVLLNRGGLHMAESRVDTARADLARCERIAREIGADLLADKAVNGLGFCELLVGNIPAALDLLGRAEAGYRAHGPGNVPIAQVDRARALMAAGLAHEAVAWLRAAATAFHAQHLTQDASDAELTLAQALAAAGDTAEAVEQARQAERHFQARGNDTGATLARLAAVRADFAGCFDPDDPHDGDDGTTSCDATFLARRTDLLAQRLDRLGLARDAALARLLSARALLRSGVQPGYVRSLVRAALPRGLRLPLETRLSAHLARAEVAAALGDRSLAYAELRKGLAHLDTHRTTLGSLDLQTGVAALGRELTGTGVNLAIASGSPHVVFAWSERARAQALLIRPVHPPQAPDTAEAIARLRHLDQLLVAPQNEGRDDRGARREHAALRRKLLEDSWTTAGHRFAPAAGHTSSHTLLRDVVTGLRACGYSMISLLRCGTGLLALVIINGLLHLQSLGDYHCAAEAARRLVSDLEARTARRLPDRLQTVIDTSIRHQLDILTAEILAPLTRHSRLLGDDDAPIVLIPTGALSALPWTLLPEIAKHPLTVCPSAHTWLAAQRADRHPSESEPDPQPVLVAGPRLAHAEREITAIARYYPAPRTLAGSRATVEATLKAMDGARTVHLATHGHHERGNVLFARIDLADGPLMAHDLQRLTKPPRRVILSACEVGCADIRSGDEHLGFTAALLHTGTATVISSSAHVTDETTPGLMTALHRGIARGTAPATALAQAATSHPYNTFVCYGSGTA